MKKFALLVVVGLISSVSAQAAQFKCAERAEEALKERRLQYAVFVTGLSEIKDPAIIGEDNDGAEYVNVTVLARDPRVSGSKFTKIGSSFKAIATYADVIYNVDAKKEQGFSFHSYMDELDQSSMELKGVGDIRLNCRHE